MSEQNGNGNGRLEKLAESKVAAAWQRMLVIIGTPLLIGVLGWIGLTLVGLDGRFARIEGKIDQVSVKVDGMERRVDRLEGWRDSFPVRR